MFDHINGTRDYAFRQCASPNHRWTQDALDSACIWLPVGPSNLIDEHKWIPIYLRQCAEIKLPCILMCFSKCQTYPYFMLQIVHTADAVRIPREFQLFNFFCIIFIFCALPIALETASPESIGSASALSSTLWEFIMKYEWMKYKIHRSLIHANLSLFVSILICSPDAAASPIWFINSIEYSSLSSAEPSKSSLKLEEPKELIHLLLMRSAKQFHLLFDGIHSQLLAYSC